MKLMWAGCIFGAGYVLGRPEARAKLAELLQRPEVEQLKQQAASTASTAAEAGRRQLSTATQKIKGATAERGTGTAGSADTGTAAATSRRGLRLPQFPRQGVRPEGSAVPAAGPVSTATETATHDASTGAAPLSETPLGETPAAPSPTPRDAQS